MALVTYDDLATPSASDPARSVAAVAVDRMKDATRPMPPDETLPGSDVDIVSRWVSAGLPRGQCAGDAAPANVDDASADAGTNACASGVYWAADADASALMHPGRACLSCHRAAGGPALALAGTVYTADEEPDDCNGKNRNVSVVVVDATGKTRVLAVNAAGNFLRATSMPSPYRAAVVGSGGIREMKTPQTDGDCNGCHAASGGVAKRIVAP